MGWFASIVILYGSWLIGHKNRKGFIYQIAGNSLWAVVGLLRGLQWDLFFVSVVFVCMYIHNYIKWTRQDFSKHTEHPAA